MSSLGPICVNCRSDATALAVRVLSAVDVSLGGGHWCGIDLRQGGSSGSSKSPYVVEPATVWRDWPLYDTTRPRDVYDHSGWR
ncbi:hypothetical protein E2C01_046455 [Portunus trituberculatus]|uniref:Uncharacterized protein n=1 Tax=Portunus trituberculatus TaxID=210409 RepID=A0A5B7G7T0_PORTR|nr:hypothetical protein [Portunus trituberculatus]